jgi:2-polyprenyl-6-methoxyphenol hydroxylase-like FAD-dependent oxidoreductase
MDRRPVLVAGGGIGGLCVALTLHQIDVPCLVLENGIIVEVNAP